MKKNIRRQDIVLAGVLSIFIASLFFSNECIIHATILFVCTALGFILYNVYVKKEKLKKPHPIVYCWIVVYFIRVIWLLGSPDPSYGIQWLDMCFSMILFPVLFQYLPLNERVVKWTLTFFVHFSFFFCIATLGAIVYHSHTEHIGILQWALHPKSYFPLAFTWTNYNHPSFLCIIYLFSLPVALGLKYRYHNISAVEWILLFLAILGVLVFTGARVGLIILPLLTVCMLGYTIVKKDRMMIVLGITTSFIVAAGILIQSTDLTFEDKIREQLMETAWTSIKEKPLLGTGTGGMKEVLTSVELAQKLNYPNAQPYSYPHNQYVGEVMSFGIVGAIPLFATLLYLLIIALRKKNFLLLSLLVILFVCMMTEMPFDIYKSINYFLFFISLLFTQKIHL